MFHKRLAGFLLPGVVFAVAFSIPSIGLAQIEEIVVFVRKMEESLQDVPLSVRALDNEQIRRLGVNDIRGVVRYTPGLEFDDGFGAQDTRIVIRGLSPTRGRPNVAFLVDGIDFTGEAIGTAGGAFSVNQRLLDVERVEIVKGPQSALYGRSAFAGAIQYITKTPSLEESEAEVRANFGSDDQYQVTAALGTPLGDKFGLRANFLFYDEGGFYNDTLTGSEVGGADGRGISLTGLWEPTEDIGIKFRGAFSDESYQPGAQARVRNNTLGNVNDSVAAQGGNNLIRTAGGPFALFTGNYQDCPTASTTADNTIASCFNTPKTITVGRVPDADQLQIKQSHDANVGFGSYPGTELETSTLTIALDWNTNYGFVNSWTGIAHTEADQMFDGDWDVLEGGVLHSPLNPADSAWAFTLPDCGAGRDCSPAGQQIVFENENDLFSQEIRYATDLEGFWNLTVGALYWNEDVDQNERSITVAPSVIRGDTTGIFGPQIDQAPTAASVFADPNNVIDSRFTGRDTEHWSVYGSLTFNFAEAWSLTLEGRYVDEELTVEGPECIPLDSQARAGAQFNVTIPISLPDGSLACGQGFRGGSSTVISNGSQIPQGPGNPNGVQVLPAGTYVNGVSRTLAAESSTDFFVPKVTLEWRADNDNLYYASVGEGRKPGGISTITGGNYFDPGNNSFDDEKLTAYEIGAKTIWAGGNVVINGSAYFQDYTDKQVGVTRFDPRIGTDVGRIENAGESEIYGIELDAQWQINDNWFLSAGYTYTDAEYSKFEATTGSSNEIARLIQAGRGGCLELIPGPPGESATCRVSYTGNRIEDVPEHAFVGYGRFTTQLGGGDLELFVDANVNYNSERFIDETNIKILDEYWLMDARVGLVAESWEVVFFVDNVFDDETVKSAVDFGSIPNTLRQAQWPPGPTDGLVASLPKPRIYGIRAAFRYGAAKGRR
ncbi:MAG: TonB-dependent receptor [Gammaproteobacteria bacterium]|nr:TonB-dependent receptor [Gammaproteobacteria bacterium]